MGSGFTISHRFGFSTKHVFGKKNKAIKRYLAFIAELEIKDIKFPKIQQKFTGFDRNNLNLF